ncbi:DUF1275 domain-containing protein [Corticibacter populi]|uniref:DUF1275 domain-containing protein n=1 Tax=Corticibacter populi TaxID=1550736 RepID=A0A3M6QJ19_9BURK|nr:YoaK family protein [Corticibacter populi]RMX03058.1 DUF1275 domain-containing protein [Corticibacter populi]RZS33497.1 uncharacterized membrane protein YoaK (UPF0700 family) [Corticibacter populi]
MKFSNSWHYVRRLTGRNRTPHNNRTLGVVLAFVAGAANAGGFLAVQQYTSHMTGIVSTMADAIALGTYELVFSGIGGLFSFIAGSACTAIMVNYARRHRLESEYAMPLLLEALLLIIFGALGTRLHGVQGPLWVPITVVLLCFIMGLQNAVVTKLSGAKIRTTHVTGIVTDIGIELGKMLYWNRSQFSDERRRVRSDHAQLNLLVRMLLSFFAGGVAGALGFKHVGYISTVPLALILVLLAFAPVLYDLRIALRHWRHWRSWRP